MTKFIVFSAAGEALSHHDSLVKAFKKAPRESWLAKGGSATKFLCDALPLDDAECRQLQELVDGRKS